MKKENDIYLSYHGLDESLAIKIKDSILSYRTELNIYLSNSILLIEDKRLIITSKGVINPLCYQSGKGNN